MTEHAAAAVIASLGDGTIDPTAYDTAWLIRAAHARPGRIVAHGALAWLRTTQHADGSWGGRSIHWHDRFVSTAGAMLALVEAGDAADTPAVARGRHFLERSLPSLRHDAYELVCSELLIPTLLDDLQARGIGIGPGSDVYRQEREQKLALVRRLPLYDPANQTTHSLEFLGADVDRAALPGALAANGSLGNSPSATAWLLTLVDDRRAAAYLDDVSSGGGPVTTLTPWENFEHQYVLYQLERAGIDIAFLAPRILERLASSFGPRGLSLAAPFVATDGDDTALAIYLCRRTGWEIDARALAHFEREAFFTTYPEERNGSLLVNLHALEAVSLAPDYPRQHAVLRKAIDHLADLQTDAGFWDDKWHISRVFIAAQAVLALAPLAYDAEIGSRVRALLDRTSRFLLETRRTDGTWGYRDAPTQEETASAVQALSTLALHGWRVAPSVIEAGVRHLDRMPVDRTPLWVAKCLFYPPHIVTATVVSARALAARALPALRD